MNAQEASIHLSSTHLHTTETCPETDISSLEIYCIPFNARLSKLNIVFTISEMFLCLKDNFYTSILVKDKYCNYQLNVLLPL